MSIYRVPNQIAGETRPASSDATFEVRNPADHRQVVSAAPDSSSEDVAAAVEAAVEAAAGWAATPVKKRADILEAAAALLDERGDDIATEMVAEMGKPYASARGEVTRTAENLRLYAGEALRLRGETYPSDPSTLVVSWAEPVGVVGVITPWNFPLSLASRKIGPALAAGNTVVFKPSSMTPRMGERLAAALIDAGLPAGVINTVHGFGAGAEVVASRDVDAITFTGSTAVGQKIHEAAWVGRRTQLELGGNNPVVVLGDADLDAAADVVARSSFALSGQACTAAGRVLIDDSVYDAILEKVVILASKLVVGPGDKAGVDLGPLIDERAVKHMEEVVADSVASGAVVATGGERLSDGDLAHGWFFPPTILAEATSETRVSQEEVFGPVVGFERISGLDDAIERSNQGEYGLTSAICTSDLRAAQAYAHSVLAGAVRVNRPTIGTPLNAPFGGIRQSGTGTHKEQLGHTVMDFYTRSKTAFFGA